LDGQNLVDWLATVRARAGVSSGMGFFYVTGGLPIADASFSREIFVPGDGCPATPCHAVRDSATLTGWTVGAGGEYALTRNWSLKAEYLFVDLGSGLDDTTASRFVAGQSLSHSADIDDLHIVRAGLNYRF
jgi:outer membrane immunogenic protein